MGSLCDARRSFAKLEPSKGTGIRQRLVFLVQNFVQGKLGKHCEGESKSPHCNNSLAFKCLHLDDLSVSLTYFAVMLYESARGTELCSRP